MRAPLDAATLELEVLFEAQYHMQAHNKNSYYLYVLQQSEGIVSVGAEPALCIEVNNTFGVVCLGGQGIFCTTCKQHSSNCRHVDLLLKVIENTPEDDMTTQLKAFSDYQVPTPRLTRAKYGKVVSERAIPFALPVELMDTWKQDDSQRFRIQDGIAHLWPPQSSTCPHCNAPSLSTELCCVQENFVVTLKCCYPAKGIILCTY